ncbi:MAG: type IV toxin-antitoxin system AbiEi family antitoxin domain-containing protein [Pseudomonadota bacterium]
MEKLIQFFRQHKGYAQMKDLKAEGFHTRKIQSVLEEGLIDKIKPGLYKLVDYPWNEESELVDVCRAKESAVICLSSALEYYGLTTFSPKAITVAVPHNTDNFVLKYPPIQVFYFPLRFYQPGIENVQTLHGIVRIYNVEKTICDMFRYRKRLGEDLALEGLKNYLKRQTSRVHKLQHYAEICQFKTIIIPYLKALVG